MGFFSSILKIGDPLGSSLFGIGSGGGGGTKNPDYGKGGLAYLKMLKAFNAGLPEQLSSEKEFQPQFTQQALQDFQSALLGLNGTPGYLDIYANNVTPALNRVQAAANTATRTANAADLQALGPEVYNAIQGVNPGESDLMRQLTESATNQLKLGTQLDPNQRDQITNMVMGDWGNRGLGTSSPAQLDAALKYFGGGQQLLQQRQNNALAVAGANQNFYTDPALQMLGINSTAPQMSQTLTAPSMGFGTSGSSLLPTDQATAMLGGTYSGAMNQQIADNNNKTALWGAGISALGSLGGGALSAI